MTLPLALSLLACLTALAAAWVALRRPAGDPAAFEALRRHAEELASRSRMETHQTLLAQLQPMATELAGLRTAQAEKLAEGFRQVAATVQEALRASRSERMSAVRKAAFSEYMRLACPPDLSGVSLRSLHTPLLARLR